MPIEINRIKHCCCKCNKELNLKNKFEDIAIIKGNFYCIDCFNQLEKEGEL